MVQTNIDMQQNITLNGDKEFELQKLLDYESSKPACIIVLNSFVLIMLLLV